MNEENEWDHKISAEVKKGPADSIRMAEVRAVLKKMKRHKAPGLSGLVAEMIQATGDNGKQWILDLCNGIVKEGSIPEDWKSSVVLPIYKGKGDPMQCGSYRGIKLLEHAMKVIERIWFKKQVSKVILQQAVSLLCNTPAACYWLSYSRRRRTPRLDELNA